MPLIKWDDSYSVHVNQIDDQHKQLFKLLNDLHDAMTVGKSKQVLDSIFDELVAYTQYHFSAEEKLMRDNGYPKLTEHMKFHDGFTTEILRFQKEVKTGKIGISIQIRDFLKDWLIKHVMGEDQKYTSFFNQKGIL
jgi:hemerythrin